MQNKVYVLENFSHSIYIFKRRRSYLQNNTMAEKHEPNEH